MTKLKKIFIIIVLTLCSSSIKALEIGDVLIKGTSASTDAGFKWNDSTAYIQYYYTGTKDDNTYNFYCLDPGFSDAMDSVKIVGNLTDGTMFSKAAEYGLATIVNIDKSVFPSSMDEYNQILTKNLAARVFLNGYVTLVESNTSWKPNTDTQAMKSSTLKAQACIWSKDANIDKACDDLDNKTGFIVSGTNSMLEVAKTITLEAIKAYNNYNPNKYAEIIKSTKKIPIESDDTSRKDQYIIKFSIKNFDKDSAVFNYLGYDIEGSSAKVNFLGYSCADGETPVSERIPEDENLLEKCTNAELLFHYEVEVPLADEESEDCESNKLEIKYNFSDINSRKGYVLQANVSSGVANYQRFLLDEPGAVDKYIIPISSCKECAPTLTMPSICEEGTGERVTNEDTGDENILYSYQESYDDKNSKYSIKKCLVKKYDQNGNSFEYSQALSNNRFCRLYCKEDLELNVPYKRYSNPGGFFQISMKVYGQQDCYSSDIDYDSYDKTIRSDIETVSEAQDEWLRTYAGNKHYNDEVGAYPRDPSYSLYTKGYSKTGDPICGVNYSSETKAQYKVVFTDYGAFYKTKNPYEYYNPSRGDYATFGHWEFVSNTTDYDNCSGSVDYKWITPEEDKENNPDGRSYSDSSLQSAFDKLNNAIKDFNLTINEYNNCIDDDQYQSMISDNEDLKATAFTNWEVKYQYDPVIKYSYDEPEPNNPNTSKWINEVRGVTDLVSGKEADQMVKVVTEGDDGVKNPSVGRSSSTITTKFETRNSEDSSLYCDTIVDDDTYKECKTGWKNQISENSYNKVKYGFCKINDDVNKQFECGESQIYYVNKIRNIHKVSTGESEYYTSRVYWSNHDDGNIIIKNALDEDQTNYSQVNGLPVGLSTPADTYFYILSLSNIGTFYSDNKLGRIFGDNNSLATLAKMSNDDKPNGTMSPRNNSTVTVDGNSYACTYDVYNSCTDEDGNVHTSAECEEGKTWAECQEDLCHCPTCNIACINDCSICDDCDGSGETKPNFEFRPITPGNINPNNRNLGYNWNVDNKNSLVGLKALNTIKEIEKRGQETDPEELIKLEEIDSEYTIKVTLTPAMITEIKKYNREQNENGGYKNKTLECYDYKIDAGDKINANNSSYNPDKDECLNKGYFRDKDGYCVMANIFCYSTYLDSLINEYESNFDAKKRVEARKISDYNNSLFENYTSKINADIKSPQNGEILTINNEAQDYWTIYRFETIDYNGDGIPDVGPSWK